MSDTTDDDGGGYLAEIENLTALVDAGHEMVERGDAIDLSNLEAAIGDLCQRMAEDPPDDPEAVTQAIQTLVTRLGELGEALKAQTTRQ